VTLGVSSPLPRRRGCHAADVVGGPSNAPAMAGFRTIVRDGRIGRDPALVTEDGGEILMEFDADHRVEVGERLTLPDGTDVVVIGHPAAPRTGMSVNGTANNPLRGVTPRERYLCTITGQCGPQANPAPSLSLGTSSTRLPP